MFKGDHQQLIGLTKTMGRPSAQKTLETLRKVVAMEPFHKITTFQGEP
jgi:hypothetical protein